MGNDTTLGKVIELLQQRGGVDGVITADARLGDLGVDSVDLVYLLNTFERTDQAEFADSDFDLVRYQTVADLADAIKARTHG